VASEPGYSKEQAEVALTPGGAMEVGTKIGAKTEKNDALMRRDASPEQHQHLAAVEAHTHGGSSVSTTDVPPALSEVRDGKATTSTPRNHFSDPTPEPPYDPMGSEDGHWVSCGGHRAPRCRVCTVLDPETGKPFEDGLDKGPDWCRGNCKWYDGECQDNSRYTNHIEHNHGNATSGDHATTAIPDILNPELTDTDEELIHMAAARGIDQADYDARQRESNQAKEDEEKKDWINKFGKYAIFSLAACLCCCACTSCYCVIRYARGGKKKEVPQAFEPETLTTNDFDGAAVEES
jgi:hypothetical protein